MMVGHALLAFALVAATARGLGVTSDRALVLGAVAGAFAAVPDADMVYAPVGLLRLESAGPLAAANAFWGASTEVHRAMTHSLVVAPIAALAFAGWTSDRWKWGLRVGSSAVLVGLIAVAALVSGLLGAVVMTAFAVAGVAVAALACRLADIGPVTATLLALVGFVTHPFGDLFTGTPPALFYPLGGGPIGTRVALSADPTLHLIGAFALELATIWLAAIVYLHLSETTDPAPEYVRRTALAGLGYVVVAPVLRPPTLDVSYHFVFSVLGVGTAVGAYGSSPWHIRALLSRDRVLSTVLTGLTAISLALVGYTVVYLATGGSAV